MNGLVLELCGLGVSPFALDAKRHPAMGHTGLVAVVGEVEHPAASGLEASMSFVRVAMLGGAHLRALPVKALQVQPDGQAANGRDLVALVRDRFLPEHVPGPMLHGRHEVVLAVRVLARDAAAVLRGPGACGAVQNIAVQRDEDLEERGRGGRGEAPQAPAVEGPKGTKLVLGQSVGELGERSAPAPERPGSPRHIRAG